VCSSDLLFSFQGSVLFASLFQRRVIFYHIVLGLSSIFFIFFRSFPTSNLIKMAEKEGFEPSRRY
ncbi:hypothetical protein, partial [Anaerotignum lactatifermentans]|uniref:hypothetical protein n=1 Tax=Anaerotignum lactatifermentans TaxID=160404 RepID=UPI00308106D8